MNSTIETELTALLADGALTVACRDGGLELTSAGSADEGAGRFVAPDELPAFVSASLSPAMTVPTGEWLRDTLDSGNCVGHWRFSEYDGSGLNVRVAGTGATLFRDEDAFGNEISRFRHDARGALNALRINAELLRLVGSQQGESSVEEPAGRILSSAGLLAGLLEKMERPALYAAPVAVIAGCRANLERAGLVVGPVGGDTDLEVPADWCVAASRLIGEWHAWHLRRSGPSAGQGALSVPLSLHVDGRSPVLEVTAEWPDATAVAQEAFPLGVDDAQAATLSSALLPSTSLAAMRVGFGAWRSGGRSGLIVGMPAR